MSSGRRFTVGVLSPLLAGQYFGVLIAAVDQEVRRAGGQIVAIQTLDASVPDPTASLVPGLSTRFGWDRMVGCVSVMEAVGLEYLEGFRAAGKPVVLVSYEEPGFLCPVVKPDNKGGMAQLLGHLVAHGRRRIGFVGSLAQSDVRERYSAYQEVLRSYGLGPDERFFFPAVNNDVSGGRTAAELVLRGGTLCDALVCATDCNAIGVQEVLQLAGVRVPEDVAVTGFDNDNVAYNTASPPLTTINPQLVSVGQLAARLLLDQVEGRQVRPGVHEVTGSLVLRSSCGCDPLSELDARRQGIEGVLADMRRALASYEDDPAWPLCQDVIEAVAGQVYQARRPADLQALSPRLAGAIAALLAAKPETVTVATVATGCHKTVELLAELAGPKIAAALPGLAMRVNYECLSAMVRHAGSTDRSNERWEQNDYDIGLELLRGDQDPKLLRWLSSTGVTAGALGLWTGPDRTALNPVGYFSADGSWAGPAAQPVAPGAIPSDGVLDQAQGRPGDVVSLIPIKTRERDWGVLALVGPVRREARSASEMYFQWGALLSVALDHQERFESERDQKQKLGRLAGRLQEQEERYSLAAQATSDGLWDWDVATGQVYYSERWQENLGIVTAGPVIAGIDWWLDRVHPQDQDRVARAWESCRGPAGGTAQFQLEHRVADQAGRWRWMLCRALVLAGPDGRARRVVGSLADITDRKDLEQQLRHQALHDNLTGLPNRKLLEDRLEQALARKRRDRRDFALIWMDLDHFKNVNDTLGHAAGDRLLQEVAGRLSQQLRRTDTVARLGGDEFVIMVDPVPAGSPSWAQDLVGRLQKALRPPVRIDGGDIEVGASFGVIPSAAGYSQSDTMLRDADLAMYRAKRTGRGAAALFSSEMRSDADGKVTAEKELRQAMRTGAFALWYQPIEDLRTGRLVSLEALVRWPRAGRGFALPAEFLSIAEQAGLMPTIGAMLLAKICRQAAEWDVDGVLPPGVRVAVNASHQEFWHDRFLPTLCSVLDDSGVDPARLAVEITEGVVMHDIEAGRAILDKLHRMGIAVYMDDFGTGHSSLGALSRLPVDVIKMDRSFVSGPEAGERELAIIRAVVQLGRTFGATVLAEGIETAEQARKVLDAGCEIGQGFWLARPTPARQVPQLLADRAGLASQNRL